MIELNFDPFPVLETERLRLRQMTLDDAPLMFALRSEASVNRFTDRPRMKSMEEAIEKLKSILLMMEKKDAIGWVIEMKDSKKPLGDISFWRLIPEHYRAEIGYSSLPEFWGKGLMSEALGCMLEYGFSKMNLHSVEANVNPANIASIRLLEKLNFVREAYFRENYYYDGKFLDSAIYSLVNRSP